MKNKRGGFTLIELMVTVIIMIILIKIMVPAYNTYVMRSRRAEAIVMISKIQQAQEKWRANNLSYTTSLGTTGLQLTSGNVTSLNSENGYYKVTVGTSCTTGSDATGSPTGTDYCINAVATTTGTQNNDTGCTTLTMSISGNNITNTPAVCWGK